MIAAFPGRFISEILAECERLPIGLMGEVLEAGSYERAYVMVENADTAESRKRLPKTAMVALVDEIDGDLAEEARQKQNR